MRSETEMTETHLTTCDGKCPGCFVGTPETDEAVVVELADEIINSLRCDCEECKEHHKDVARKFLTRARKEGYAAGQREEREKIWDAMRMELPEWNIKNNNDVADFIGQWFSNPHIQ
jgi:hypothetical protein